LDKNWREGLAKKNDSVRGLEEREEGKVTQGKTTGNSSGEAHRYLHWNFFMGVIHGVFYKVGMAFSEPNMILPLFLNTFTKSKTLIGLFGTLFQFSGAWPQLLTAQKIQSICRKKPLLIVMLVIRMASWGILGLITYFYGAQHPGWILIIFLLLLSLFYLAGGVAGIPFFDIIAKAIPTNMRGRFWGIRQFLGGILAIGAGFAIKWILATPRLPFPKNYAVLFLLSFVFLGISYLGLGSIREPQNKNCPPRKSFNLFLKEAFQTLHKDKNFAQAIFTEILAGSLLLSLSFYVLYAKNVLKVEASMVGIFVAVQMLAGVLSNLVWGMLSDRIGNKSVIRGSLLFHLSIPFFALVSGTGWMYMLVFFGIGFYMNGASIGFTNFMLEVAPEEKRPLYISLRGTLVAVVSFFPLFGGIFIDLFSFRTVFMAVLIVSILANIMASRLREPRRIVKI